MRTGRPWKTVRVKRLSSPKEKKGLEPCCHLSYLHERLWEWPECIAGERKQGDVVCGLSAYVCRGGVGRVGREGRGSYSCGVNSWSCPGKRDQPGQVEGGEARGHDPGGGLRERLHKEVHLQKPRGGRASIRLWNQTMGPFFPQCRSFPRCFTSILLNAVRLVALLIQPLEKHHLKYRNSWTGICEAYQPFIYIFYFNDTPNGDMRPIKC